MSPFFRSSPNGFQFAIKNRSFAAKTATENPKEKARKDEEFEEKHIYIYTNFYHSYELFEQNEHCIFRHSRYHL